MHLEIKSVERRSARAAGPGRESPYSSGRLSAVIPALHLASCGTCKAVQGGVWIRSAVPDLPSARGTEAACMPLTVFSELRNATRQRQQDQRKRGGLAWPHSSGLWSCSCACVLNESTE